MDDSQVPPGVTKAVAEGIAILIGAYPSQREKLDKVTIRVWAWRMRSAHPEDILAAIEGWLDSAPDPRWLPTCPQIEELVSRRAYNRNPPWRAEIAAKKAHQEVVAASETGGRVVDFDAMRDTILRRSS